MRKLPTVPRFDGGPQTVLLVTDVDAAVEFYGACLRLEMRDGDPGRYAEFNTGEGGVLVLVKRDGSIAPMVVQAVESGAHVSLGFTIGAEDYEPWKAWLTRRGVAIERETKWIHGGRSLYVLDPDGRRLEFKTPPIIAAPKLAPFVAKKREDQ